MTRVEPTSEREALTRGLPEADATEAEVLAFRCTSCGVCCRQLRVALTAHDVLRLTSATRLPLSELVEWLPPEAVDPESDPHAFVELDVGRRLLVLAHAHGGCRLLGSDDRCQAYVARPRDCRTFPFDVGAPDERGHRRLALLQLVDCAYDRDGHEERERLIAEDAARGRELADYQVFVARWNRRAWHRRRLHRSSGRAEQFLAAAVTQTAGQKFHA